MIDAAAWRSFQKLYRYVRLQAATFELIANPETPRLIHEVGASYASVIRQAIGADGLARSAQEDYVRGRIDVDEFERQLDRIAREFPSDA